MVEKIVLLQLFGPAVAELLPAVTEQEQEPLALVPRDWLAVAPRSEFGVQEVAEKAIDAGSQHVAEELALEVLKLPEIPVLEVPEVPEVLEVPDEPPVD